MSQDTETQAAETGIGTVQRESASLVEPTPQSEAPDFDPVALVLLALECWPLREAYQQLGRLPFAGDEHQPWSFRGWNIPYLLLAEATAAGTGRWAYYLALRANAKLPDEPIPQLAFGSSAEAQKTYLEAVALIEQQGGAASGSWRTFLHWLGWSLALVDEPPQLSERTQEALYRSFTLEHILNAPGDHLGACMCEWMGRGQRKGTGFFPTPTHLAVLMSELTLGSQEANPLQPILDPCVGAGVFLLAASNYSINLSGVDVNPDCVLATRIQGALYAPWMTYGVPSGMLPRPKVDGKAHSSPQKAERSDVEAIRSPIQLDLGLG